MPVPAGGDEPTDLYTDLPTVKASLGKTSDDDRDELIEQAIRSACRSIDRITGRRFYADTAASARVFRVSGNSCTAGGDQVLLVDDVASLDDLTVETGAGTSWSAFTAYETGPDNALVHGQPITSLFAASGWLPAAGRVRVTALWGWPAVPDEIAQAALLLAARLYRRKDSPQGVMGSADWGAIRVSRVDPDVEALTVPFTLPGIA